MNAILSVLRAAVREHPGFVVAFVLLLTGSFAAISAQAGAGGATDPTAFAPDNEAFRALDTISEEFAGSTVVPAQIAVVGDADGDVLSAAGIRTAVELQHALRADPTIAAVLVDDGTQPAVVSFADLVLQSAAAQQLDPTTLDDDAVDGLFTGTLEQMPEAQRGLATALLSADADAANASASAGVIVVFFDGEAEGLEAAQLAMGELPLTANGFDVYAFNEPLLQEQSNAGFEAQMGRLLALAFLLIVLILIAIYRSFGDVVASLFGLIFAIVWMQGLSALVGPAFLGWTGPMNEMGMAIPILLVGLGVDYGIHLTMRYREERATGAVPAAAVSQSISAVGAALLLATITTVVGFLSGLTNPLPPMRDFGVFAALGVVAAFLVMTTFVPAVRLLIDGRKAKRGTLADATQAIEDWKPSLLGRLTGSFAPTAVRRPFAVLAVAGAITVLGAIGATQLSTEFSQTEFFPEDSRALETFNVFTERFGGDLAEQTEVLVTGDVATVDALEAMLAFQADLAEVDGVRELGGQVQVASPVSALFDLATETPEVPGDRYDAGVAERATELGVFGAVASSLSGGDADVAALYEAMLAADPSVAGLLSRGDSAGFDAARFTLNTTVGEEVVAFQQNLAPALDGLRSAELDAVPTSGAILIDDVMVALRDSQVISLVVTLLASMAILAFVFWIRERRPMLGVLAIVTVTVVVSWVFGTMALLGIPFNVMTAVVSALAIGIGVPFGIHVVNRFTEDRKRYDDTLTAMTSTLQHTGGALVGSAMTTVAGFGVLTLASIRPMQQFGLVVAITIAYALLSSVLVLPALLTVWDRRRLARKAAAAQEAAPVRERELVRS